MPTITETVREIALNQPTAIRVFERFGIDYCCGGRKPLAVACQEQDVEIDEVLSALALAASQPSPEETDWSKASLADLVEHINSRHHEYLKTELPRLTMLAGKVVAAHGSNHLELTQMQSAVQDLSSVLEALSSRIDAAYGEGRAGFVPLRRGIGARACRKRCKAACLLWKHRKPHRDNVAGARRCRRTAGENPGAQRKLHGAARCLPHLSCILRWAQGSRAGPAPAHSSGKQYSVPASPGHGRFCDGSRVFPLIAQ